LLLPFVTTLLRAVADHNSADTNHATISTTLKGLRCAWGRLLSFLVLTTISDYSL